MAEGLPFYLELLSYDAKNVDTKSLSYAKAKPQSDRNDERILENPV